MIPFKKILAIGSAITGGYLVFSGLSGRKIPYIEETDEAAVIKNRILNGEIKLDFAPVIYDSSTKQYTVWYRSSSFPGRTKGPFKPKIDGLAINVTYPGQADEWEDAKEIYVEITNTSSKKSEMAYISVVAASFGARPSREKNTGIFWYHSQPIQPVLPVAAGASVSMMLGDIKGDMKSALQSFAGADFENIGLIVTLYSDWAGTAVYDSANVLTRENDFMRQVIADGNLPGEATWFVKT